MGKMQGSKGNYPIILITQVQRTAGWNMQCVLNAPLRKRDWGEACIGDAIYPAS